MGIALKIRDGFTSDELRRHARREHSGRAAARIPAERFLSLRVLDDTEAIIDACRTAWNAITAEQRHLKYLANYPWDEKVIS